ncbi:DNA recombination protein RmuC [Balneicella halophila]|uniref:DNA recombination protein RmuC n=1 Tax=Balneicella halophila TaxID=1537566 RepID=A0A7L4UNH6_BALHA|nr:DNA recombination protein RmuC [Balneicella halophila]
MTSLELNIFIAIVITALVVFLIMYLWFQRQRHKLKDELLVKENQWQIENSKLQQKIDSKEIEIAKAYKELEHQEILHANLQDRIEELLQESTRLGAEKQALTENLENQKNNLAEMEERFRVQFENLASKILKQNTIDFSETQQKNISEILNPLKEKIQTFEKKVEDTYEKGLKDQTDLKAELKKLYELNSQISTEANNLTKALKGDVKQQGNWGELVLERVLERSGLSEGAEYQREKVVNNDLGERVRLDVLIKLPDNKHLIVDSKVSLIAYEKAVNEENEIDRLRYLKEHVNSIKKHIKVLSEKHYSSVSGLQSPDFVLLFIPVESSFALAVQQDNELFNIAWDNKIVIVSPSTLLATLRTVSSIWKQEHQTQNVQEIARQGALLYDKFVNFYNDLEKVGVKMDEAQRAYSDSMKKLYDGKDNLVRKAERLRELGARPKKELPEELRERAGA